jgi:hypothetical protein
MRINLLLSWLLLWWMSPVPADADIAPALLPTQFTSVYTLKKGSITVGETTRSLRPLDDGRFVFESVTRPVGIARLLTSGQVVEHSEWRLRQYTIQPLHYSYFNSSSKKNRDERLEFDWTTRTITDTISGEPWQMPLQEGALDKLVYQLQIMLDLARNKTSLHYTIAGSGKLKTYEIEILGTETITTPLGKFETVRVRRVHGKRRTTLWCARRLRYLPVRIEHRKAGESPVTATLKSIRGI